MENKCQTKTELIISSILTIFTHFGYLNRHCLEELGAILKGSIWNETYQLGVDVKANDLLTRLWHRLNIDHR